MPEHDLIKWRIEKLTPGQDRTLFDCGKQPLNDFIQKYASQNQRLGVSQTYVAIRPGANRIEGYYAISSGAVLFATLPDETRKGLPRYPIPVAHIGRLAVEKAAQGKGLGRVLLLDAMERILQAADFIGIHAIEVWAKDDDAKRFYVKYGFVPLMDDQFHLYMSIKTVGKLGLL